MNTQLQYLIELQKFDLRIFQILDQQKKIPGLLQAAEAPLRELQGRLQAMKHEGESLARQRKNAELELGSQEAQLQKVRARLSELKTNKEYQAHLFEIELARKKKDTFEEAVLALMERSDQNSQAIKELELQVEEAQKNFESEKAKLDKHAADLTNEIAQLDQEQKQISQSLEQSLLSRYNRLKTIRKGFAVAEIRDGSCIGCRLQLPPQLVAEVRRGDQLLDCSYCRRILYMANQLETESTE
ncbi:MAG: zinc ribbon domain-containing protein [Nitrospirales bacterium]|nr:C4-type zinc ribbon domain-containing protein [Nitrospirales bacterium]